MKEFKLYLMISVTLFFLGCGDDFASVPSSQEIPDSVIRDLELMGYSTDSLVVLSSDEIIDPVYQSNSFLVEGDIIYQPHENDYGTMDDVRSQYRGQQLLINPQVIDIVGVTNDDWGLDLRTKELLQEVVEQYNSLDIGLEFRLSFKSRAHSSDEIVVYRTSSTRTGGATAQPRNNGKPYRYLALRGGNSGLRRNVERFVIAHELGHSIGLRHSDWFDKSLSCNGKSRSERNPAIHIPGTPEGFAWGVMRSCFNKRMKYAGEFSSADSLAIETLYRISVEDH